MENSNIKKNKTSNSVWGGAILIIIGLIFLFDNLNLNLPSWVMEWHTFMLVIGLVIGARSNYSGRGWLILVVIGGLFTLEHILKGQFDAGKIVWPLMLMIVGIILILKPKGKLFARKPKDIDQNYDSGAQFNPIEESAVPNKEDVLDSVNVFGGSNQKVYSKNFKGGDILAIFGGCDVDLTQAEFENQITIDVTTIFGGCKIIIPPTWEVRSEISAILGGVDDKRSLMHLPDAPKKRVILKGVVLCGGVDIRNY